MSKTIKTISIVASLLIALVIAGILLLPKLINADTFKQQITQQVEQKTGQKLAINGDIKLSIFPWLSLKTGAIELSQPAGITAKGNTNKPLLQVSSAQLGVKLLPLLQSKFELGKIVLNKPKLHFVTTKDGSTSLTGLQNASDSSSSTISDTAQNTSPSQPSSSAGSTLGAIAISGISIIDGDFVFEDQSNNTLYQLSQLEIEAGNISSLKQTPVKMSGLVVANADTSNDETESFNVALESQISYSDDLSSINLEQLKASIVGDSQSPLADIQKISTSVAELSFNQETQVLDIQNLSLDIDNGKLAPSLSIPSITVTLSEHKTSAIDFRLEEKNLELKTRGSIKLQDWDEGLIFKGRIVSEEFSPKKLLKFLEVDYTPTDETVLRNSKFSTDFTGSAHGLSLRNIDFIIDESLLIGDVSLMNFEDPHYMFDLDLNEINVDRYAPIDTNTTAAASSNPAPASPNQNNTAQKSDQSDTGLAIVAPLPLFKKIKANGMFRTTSLQANGAKLSQIVVDVKSKDKKVIIKPKAKLYDGQMDGVITFVDKGDSSTLHITQTLQGVNFGPLLQDTDVTDQINGKGTAKTDITFVEKNGKQTNNGTIAVSVLDGALKDIDIKKILDEAQDNFDSLRGKEVKTKPAKNPETRFAQMNATLNLNNNVITNNDLNIKAPAFRIGGKGAINLTPKTLDYATSVVVVNTNDGQGGKAREDLRGLSIPVRFYGDLTDPEYTIDFAALLKENSRRELDRKKEELRQKAAEKLGLTNKEDPEAPKDLETELKEQVIEKLFEKLF